MSDIYTLVVIHDSNLLLVFSFKHFSCLSFLYVSKYDSTLSNYLFYYKCDL